MAGRAEIDVKLSKLRHSLHAEFWKPAADKNLWHRLSPDEATSTGSAELRIQETTGGSEIVADGTLSANSQYTVEFPLGQNQKLTALKIEVLPKDLEAASRTPEPGFVLSHLRTYLIGAKEQPREIDFQLAVCDEAEPFFRSASQPASRSVGLGGVLADFTTTQCRVHTERTNSI